MKHATQEVIFYFPVLESYLTDRESVILSNEALSNMSDAEEVFLRLIWFFENPNQGNFNLESLYQKLDNDWLEFAIEVIDLFFKKDTYLIEKPTTSFISEKKVYYNQKEFADFLTEHGVPFSRPKLNTYMNRNKLPQPDLVVSETKYWLTSTCFKYLEELKGVYHDKS